MNPAQPLPEPSRLPEPRLYTVAEYTAIGEIEDGYSELSEGRIMMAPNPMPGHNRAAFRLAFALESQVPADFAVVPDVDVDLQLSSPNNPGFSRRPDVIVVSRAEMERVAAEGGMIRASEVVLIVEVVSPGSVRTNNVTKRAEYADAAIPHYWIVDLSEPVSVLACHLAGEFGYADGGAATGALRVTEPFDAELDLATLS